MKRTRSSITEHSLHGINTSRQSGEVLPMCPVQTVTYVSGRATNSELQGRQRSEFPCNSG
jgi:hypothetical protein